MVGLVLTGLVDFDDVAYEVHKAQNANRKEADGVEGEERSDDELLSADVFEHTEDAIDTDKEFDEGEPRELLCVVAGGLLLGTGTALRGADEAALATGNGSEHGLGVADGDTYTQSHENRHAEQADLPTGVAGATLCNEVKNGRRDSCEEDETETDGVTPSRNMCDRFKEGEKRPCAEGGEQHAGVNGIVRRVEDGSNLYAERNLGAKNARENLDGSLDGTLGPAELLCLECVDVVREFCRNDNVEYELHLPTGKLGTVGKVHVFGKSVAFPAATAIDGLLAPYTCGTVEVHEKLAPATSGLFNNKVAVDTDGLGEGQTGFGAVQVAPATLDETNLLIHDHVRNGLQEEVLLRDEVCIENGEEFTLCNFHGFFQSACFEFLAVRTMNELDVVTFCG